MYTMELRPPDRRAAVFRTLRTLLEADLTEIHARLRRLEIDTLVIWGSKDEVLPVALGRRLAKELPRARLVTLDAGHVPNQECPSEVAARVEEFLKTSK